MKILIAHPAQQHSYRLATAFKRTGDLAAYVTTVYNAPKSLTRVILPMLPKELQRKAQNRVCVALEETDVKQRNELGGLLTIAFHNIKYLRKWYWDIKRWNEDRFAISVAKIAQDIKADAVISFDGTSPLLFETLMRDAPEITRILDMSAANALYLKEVYERDFAIKPAFAKKLRNEWQRIWNPKDIERTRRELLGAEYYLCGSEFVVKSLEYSGIDASSCAICHYGVDAEKFRTLRSRVISNDGPVRFIFIGGTNELKGIGYLLDAFLSMSSKDATLTVVGHVNLDADQLALYENRVNFTGSVPHSEIPKYLDNADVMLFPSLGDGFPLSAMEALSCGVPVVCSENTGTADVIVDGVNGFVIPAQSQSALGDVITWFIENKNKILEMSINARKTAEVCTWDRYYEAVWQSVSGFVSDDGRSTCA